MAKLKVFNFEIKAGQIWEGTISCNGGEPEIKINTPIDCEVKAEESFHRVIKSFIDLCKKCENVEKAEFNINPIN